MTANMEKEMFAGRDVPAWHKLGNVFYEDLLMTQAFELGGLNYKTSLEPIYAKVGETGFCQVEGKVAVVRHPLPNGKDDEYRTFGIVSPNYGLLDNMWIAERMDYLLGGEWYAETCGAIGDGQIVFATVKLGEFELPNGDTVIQYLLMKEGKTGTHKAKFAVVHVRVVCQNTLMAAESSAKVEAEFIHNVDIKAELDFRFKFLESLKDAQERTVKGLVQMMNTALNTDRIQLVLEHIYPYPKRPARAKITDDYNVEDIPDEYHEFFRKAQKSQSNYQYFINRADRLRELAYSLYEKFNDEYPASAQTGYALYNAVTESADWRNDAKDEIRTVSVATSAVFGQRAQEKMNAWKTILSLPVAG